MTEETMRIVDELGGTRCRCRRPKFKSMTFCPHCYSLLPRKMQMALYRTLGHGYEEAYAAAAAWLDQARGLGVSEDDVAPSLDMGENRRR